MPSAEPIAVCDVCGDVRLTPLRHYSCAHLVRCANCRFVFSGLRPTPEEIARHYDGYPRTDFDSPITRQRYRELLDSFEPYRRTGRILDVGCGIGFFLEEAQRRGWDPYGTEYGERAVKINRAKGLKVVDVSSGITALGSATFDVVTAFEVMEHVADPRGEALRIAELLREGGLFYCTTPNFNALTRRILRSRWSVIEYPEHLSYFTPKTISRLLVSVGFVSANVVSTGIDPSAFRGRDGTGKPVVSGEDAEEHLRTQIEGSPLLRGAKTVANAVLTTAGAGDTLKGRFELESAREVVARR